MPAYRLPDSVCIVSHGGLLDVCCCFWLRLQKALWELSLRVVSWIIRSLHCCCRTSKLQLCMSDWYSLSGEKESSFKRICIITVTARGGSAEVLQSLFVWKLFGETCIAPRSTWSNGKRLRRTELTLTLNYVKEFYSISSSQCGNLINYKSRTTSQRLWCLFLNIYSGSLLLYHPWVCEREFLWCAFTSVWGWYRKCLLRAGSVCGPLRDGMGNKHRTGQRL